ncbi:glycosyltransferase [Arthrobacter mangrovi]|uniref:SIR2-like domain-containing protein n=1 Tax=Arthrobacter mangrovi TaxID=2966350 RepID=A0ABQ5MX50_9MICC|nr:glycosyltransferase [Arthrobacter mangrovi]GLB68562.1 hypothetical protein AHIS1636_30040 [Arthrobacter mangrovi]
MTDLFALPGRTLREGKRSLRKSLKPVAKAVLPTVAGIAGETIAPRKPARVPAASVPAVSAEREPAAPSIIEIVAGGGSLAPTIIREARSAIAAGEAQTVLSAGHSLRASGSPVNIVRSLRGMALLVISGTDLAWREFRDIDDDRILNLCPAEYFAAAFGEAPDEASETLERLLANQGHEEWPAAAVLSVAGVAFARNRLDAARLLTLHGLGRPLHSLTRLQRRELERLQTWFPEGSRRRPLEKPQAAVNFGLLSYQQPDAWSRNVGDYIQTLSSIGHLVRHSNLEFAGDPDLVQFLEGARSRVKDERRLDSAKATVGVVETFRDASTLQDIPENTWAFAFGWYMHHTFGQTFNFPFHANIRPIFISFHVNKPDMLTPEAIDYLKAYGPVGCRDWQTVALLRAAGVPAFFSGCMTTTVDTVFRREGSDDRTATAFVDAPKTGEGDILLQTQRNMREMSFTDKLGTAVEWVGNYHERYRNISTSRLHCFLPARSVGCDVDFHPKNPSDVRFGGLIGTTPQDFDKIRQGILDKLAAVVPLIAGGASEDVVYAKWAEVCAPAMAEADRFLAMKPAVEPTAEDISGMARSALSSDGKAVDVVVDLRPGRAEHLQRLVNSIAAATTAEVRLWVPDHDIPQDVKNNLRLPSPSLSVQWLSGKELSGGFGPVSAQQRRNVLLALVPEILAGSSRAVYINDAVMLRADIADLLRTELGGQVVAARDEHRKGYQSGFRLLRSISIRHRANHAKAMEMVAVSHALHPFDFRVFDASVLVMDLEAARSAGVARSVVGLLVNYKMDFGEALNAVLGAARSPLDPAWNYSPLLGDGHEARLVNWRDGRKPWSSGYAPFAEEWRRL